MITVALVYGGASSEHEVSLRSAAAVIQYLDYNQFRLITVKMTKMGHWLIQAPNEPLVESIVFPTHLECDVILSVMHGAFGEDGTLPALFRLWGKPYVGSEMLGSVLGMDKILAKQLVKTQGDIPVVPFMTMTKPNWKLNERISLKTIETLGYPIFVKPSNQGSSIGITKVHTADKLVEAVSYAFQYSHQILIEKAISPVREIEIAALEALSPDASLLLSVAGEVITPQDFYSYDAKYVEPSTTILQIPAVLTVEQNTHIRAMATKIFRLLRLRHLARIDFFWSEQEQLFYFNEVNTLPGLTEVSMYPKLWESSGKPLNTLLTHLIQLALASPPLLT